MLANGDAVSWMADAVIIWQISENNTRQALRVQFVQTSQQEKCFFQ